MALSWWPIPAAVVGWCLGWLSAWTTERLQPEEDTQAIRGRSALIRDPFVQGACALVWAAIPLKIASDPLRWVEVGLLAIPMVQVTVTDFRTRYVYTVVAAVGLALGLVFGWPWSVVGAVGGAVAFTLLYVIGRLVYRGGEPMARGDISIAAMVGAAAAICAAQALLVGILLSGLLALGALLIGRSRHAFMPYGPGLCLGGLATLFLC